MQRLKNKVHRIKQRFQKRIKESNVNRIIANLPSSNKLIRNVQLIQTPTPSNVGQPIHPSLISLPNKYAMAFTPFPDSNSLQEWPCVVQSKKLPYFETFGSRSLPVVKHTQRNFQGDYLNDPDLYFNEGAAEFWLYYIETLRKNNKVTDQRLILKKSVDGNRWSEPVVLRHDNFMAHNRERCYLVSPSILRVDSKLFFLYAVDLTKKRKIVRLESQDSQNWHNKVDIDCPLPHNLIPWHISVLTHDGVAYLLISATITHDIIGNVLLLASSNDLSNWQVSPQALLKPSKSLLDSKVIYRSSGIVEEGILKLLFSFKNHRNVWNTAYGEFIFSEFSST